MAADSKHAEALARIEHKMDIIMAMLAWMVAQMPPATGFLDNILKQVGNSQHKCFLCGSFVSYGVDPVDSVVVRKCDCKTGKIAIDMKAFAPPALPVIKETDSGEQEDRNDATSRRRPPGR